MEVDTGSKSSPPGFGSNSQTVIKRTDSSRSRDFPSEAVLADLEASGLTPEDMQIRVLGGSERATAGCGGQTDGYVIPYLSLNEELLPFYRIKILNPDKEGGTRYRQPKKAPNHIYFPPGFKETLFNWCKKNPSMKLVIITEGEKKAACATKMGIPTVGLGGVDSWRNRTLTLSSETELSSKGDKSPIKARLPSNDSRLPETATLAEGFADLIDMILQLNLTVFIIFDSDRLGTLKAEVARAAAVLAYELRFLGLTSSQIRQIILPDMGRRDSRSGLGDEDGTDQSIDKGGKGSKTGLDDYLVAGNLPDFLQRLGFAFNDRQAFPKHPNPRGYVNAQLENALSRKSTQQVASVILTELDARGLRLRDPGTGEPFYYDGKTHKLMPAVLLARDGRVLHKSPFGTLIYKEFGLTANDQRVLIWLASQFTGEEPIADVHPKRVTCLISHDSDPQNPNGVAVQASDSEYFAVSGDIADPLRLHVNGTNNILFESDQVEPLDTEKVLEYFEEFQANKGFQPFWAEAVYDSNLGRNSIINADSDTLTPAGKAMRDYALLLFYISPFFQRWKGTQLPIEIMLGEAGSGKSSLYGLRLAVLTGRTELRNIPNDIRDWYASISNAGGLHVTDNVHFSKSDLKQKMSDEICRLITEPKPMIGMRKLYTETEEIRAPITCTFAITAINMPFTNTDIIQRAAIFEAASLGKKPDGDWASKHLDKHGGREAWVAHQLVFMHRFLNMAAREKKKGGWDDDFVTSNRLAHLEQCLTIAGRVIGLNTDFLRTVIKEVQATSMADADWTLNGIKDYVSDALEQSEFTKQPGYVKFATVDVCDWASGAAEYMQNVQLSNQRRLGKYMMAHRSTLDKVCNVRMRGIEGNKIFWCVGKEP